MLSPTKKIMVEYKTLLVKMALDNFTNQQAMLNYEHFCDLQLLLGLVCILPLLEFCTFSSSLQSKDLFACDLVATIKVYPSDVYNMYCDQTTRFIVDNF